MTTHVTTPIVEALRQRLHGLDGGVRHRRAVLPFGVPAIDTRLPDGGLALGALHEVASGGNGAVDGAAAALFAAGVAARTRGRVLWCVTRQDLFAPALAAAGLAPDRVIYVEVGDEKALLACFEEGLRHGRGDSGRGGFHGAHRGHRNGVGAVIGEVARLSMTASRRLQLAAEGSGAIGIAIRRLPAFHRTRGTITGTQMKSIAATRDSLPRLRRWDGEGGWPQQALSLPSAPLPNPPPQTGEGMSPDFEWAAERGHPADFTHPTAAVTRWCVSALPSAPLPTVGVGRARWRLDLIRCRGGEAACFDVEACDAQGCLAPPADLVHGPGQAATGQQCAAR